MRKIQSFDVPRITVEDVLNEFHERHKEFGITKKSDIISVSVRPATKSSKIAQPEGNTKDSQVVVTFFYWGKK
jgi:hypothetical protein